MTKSQLAQQQLDKHAGQGGSYVIDANGSRALVERTKQPGENTKATSAGTVENKKTVKGKQ